MPFLDQVARGASSGATPAEPAAVPSSAMEAAPPVDAATTHLPQPDNNDMHYAEDDDDRHLDPSQFTRVDGRGLWRSWTRNFKNKLLALLDLIDNSLDASIVAAGETDDEEDDEFWAGDFVGRVHIYPDEVACGSSNGNGARVGQSSSTNSGDDFLTLDMPDSNPVPDAAVSSANGTAMKATGLCIVNNSVKPIRPLVRVLEVYNSSKVHSGSGDIGENGVGLKQGCATLSDLSFVLAKNGKEGFVELGIIAESLQRVEGCYLPAFRFAMPDDDDTATVLSNIRQQMVELFTQVKHVNVARCIEQYGSVAGGSASNIDKGIDRLCAHFASILDFYGSRHVFAVVLDNIHSDGARRADPIQELREAIPRTYLHIPENFDFRIGTSRASRKKIVFQYWPQRLVELSSFTVKIHETIPWHASGAEHGGYNLRVFVGFDRMRINDPVAKKEASLYIYSRQSGRLIKVEPDARFFLGLAAGGSTYCQGLTVLVDDIGGKLPLNPTKQDVAFGEQANGEVHKANLFAYTGAVAKFHYDYHLAKFGGKKTRLTANIKDFGSEFVEGTSMKVIDSCKLTTFSAQWKIYGTKWVRVNQKTAIEMPGPDTHFRLISDPPTPPPVVSEPILSNVASSDVKRRRTDESREQNQYPTGVANQRQIPTTLTNLQPQYTGSSQQRQVANMQERMQADIAALSSRLFPESRTQPTNMNMQQQSQNMQQQIQLAAAQNCQPTQNAASASHTQNARNPVSSAGINATNAGGVAISHAPGASTAASTEAIVDLTSVQDEMDNNNGAGADATTAEDEVSAASSTKEEYAQLCNDLTNKLEERKEKNRQLKKEVHQLRAEVERLTLLLNKGS